MLINKLWSLKLKTNPIYAKTSSKILTVSINAIYKINRNKININYKVYLIQTGTFNTLKSVMPWCHWLNNCKKSTTRKNKLNSVFEGFIATKANQLSKSSTSHQFVRFGSWMS